MRSTRIDSRFIGDWAVEFCIVGTNAKYIGSLCIANEAVFEGYDTDFRWTGWFREDGRGLFGIVLNLESRDRKPHLTIFGDTVDGCMVELIGHPIKPPERLFELPKPPIDLGEFSVKKLNEKYSKGLMPPKRLVTLRLLHASAL
jgi:hypothetical protein